MAQPTERNVIGYVITNAEGSFLSQGLRWFPHDNSEQAWVHPEHAIESIRRLSESWAVKPTQRQPAIYSRTSGTVLLGHPEPF